MIEVTQISQPVEVSVDQTTEAINLNVSETPITVMLEVFETPATVINIEVSENQTGPPADSDNIDITKRVKFTIQDGVSNASAIVEILNSFEPYTINDAQSLWIVAIAIGQFGLPDRTFIYKIVNKGKGTYGNGATQFLISDLLYVAERDIIISDIIEDETTVTINLGDHTSHVIETVLNTQNPPITIQDQSLGLTLFTVTDTGATSTYLWLGTPNTYGIGNSQSAANDFQLINLDETASYNETDPAFQAWLASNPLSAFLTEELEPAFNAWLDSNPLSGFLTSETDPVFQLWLTGNPLAGFLTSETDPVFQLWLAGNPLAPFLTTETDPVFQAWLASNPSLPIEDTWYNQQGTHINMPVVGGASLNNVEGVPYAVTGATPRSFSSASPYLRNQRVGIVSATAGNPAQMRQLQLLFTRNSGFDVWFKFGMAEGAAETDVRFFGGISTITGVFSNIDPLTMLNIVAVVKLPGDTSFSLIHNDASGLATKIPFSSDYPANTVQTDVYYCNMKAVASGIQVKTFRFGTVFNRTDILTSNIPSLTQGLNTGFWICDTVGPDIQVGFDFMGCKIKS